MKVSPTVRKGRPGSRTPRNKTRDEAVSPENGRNVNRFTPGPDGPPPDDGVASPPVPPVPPIPMVSDGPDGNVHFCSSFVSGLYDTCESKPRNKLGDLQWKPRELLGDDVLSPSEAKQLWLEREVRSLKFALDRVAVPPPINKSDFWNGGLESAVPQDRVFSGTDGTAHGLDGRNLRGGCGVTQLPDRASLQHGGSGTLPAQAWAASGGCGDPALLDRAHAAASHVHGADRALQLHGDVPAHDRAWQHGAHLDQGRASLQHGDLPERDRAFCSMVHILLKVGLHGSTVIIMTKVGLLAWAMREPMDYLTKVPKALVTIRVMVRGVVESEKDRAESMVRGLREAP